MRWQMALYKEMAGKSEDADAPVKVVKRVQEVSAVLYHLEVVRLEKPVILYSKCECQFCITTIDFNTF